MPYDLDPYKQQRRIDTLINAGQVLYEKIKELKDSLRYAYQEIDKRDKQIDKLKKEIAKKSK